MSFDLKIIDGDLSIVNGDLEQVSNSNKLEQDILKITLTPIGSNPIATWYGSPISKTLIGSYLSEDIVLNTGKNQLINSIENLKKLQQEQFNSGQQMTADEQIFAVQNVQIIRNKLDYRIISVFINVMSKAFSRVSTSFKVKNF